MRHGGIVSKTKQKCRTIVYIALILLLVGTYVKSNLFSDEKSFDWNASHNSFKSRVLLEYRPIFDDSRLQEWRAKHDREEILKRRTTTTTTATSTTTVPPPTISSTTFTSVNKTNHQANETLYHGNKTNHHNNTKPHHHHNCGAASISEFPGDLLTQKQRQHGGFLLHVIVSVYMCVGLAIVCDYYFVPSLEVICYKLELQSDVAGATLMAVGSSAPELFASIIGVFITNGDIGIGTILGSAIFNVLFVLGMSGIVAKTALQLAWWPLMRDGLCYSLSLIVLAVVIVDGRVTWIESVIMLFIYVGYVIIMWKNRSIEKAFYLYVGYLDTYEERFGKLNKEEEGADEQEQLLSAKERIRHEKCMKIGESGIYNYHDDDDLDCSSEDSIDAVYPDEDPVRPLDIPDGTLDRIVWFLNFPLNGIFYVTIPDIRFKSMRKFFSIAFLMSIIWIGILTYILVWMMTVVGYTFNIPDSVMGLTFIAFGSSVPDAFASIVVAKQGKGDMAVSQAIGSNVFDVLLGLGLPWILKTLIFDYHSAISVESFGILISCFSIFLSVVFLMVGFYYCKFQLSRKFGIFLLIMYVLFIIISVLMEIYFWSSYHLPTCSF